MAKASQKKDKKITIIRSILIENDMLEMEQSWVSLPQDMNIWAYYRQASANEVNGAIVANYKVEAIFEINWRDDLDAAMKISYKGKEYNITRIDDFEGYKEGLRIYAYKVN